MVMKNGFTKGFLAGGLVASAMMTIMSSRTTKGSKRKMLRNGRNLVASAGRLADDLVDMFK